METNDSRYTLEVDLTVLKSGLESLQQRTGRTFGTGRERLGRGCFSSQHRPENRVEWEKAIRTGRWMRNG